MKRCSGFTLMEVMVSFGILVTTGTLMFHFMYPSKAASAPWTNDYGTELSKITLLTMPTLKDTIIEHTDATGSHWEIRCEIVGTIAPANDGELCAKATAIRNNIDTTRTVHLCRFGEAP